MSIALSWNVIYSQENKQVLDSCLSENFKGKYTGDITYKNEIIPISMEEFQGNVHNLYKIMNDSSLTGLTNTRELILTMNLLLFADSSYCELLFQNVKNLETVEEIFYSYYLNYLKCNYDYYHGKCGGTDFRNAQVQYGGLNFTCSMYYVEGITNFSQNTFIANSKSVSEDIILR